VLKEKLYEAIEHFDINLIIVENALTIPMNIPLGAALVEVVIESGTDCIAHHHDFVWERDRYLVNAVEDYLHAAFPPRVPQIHHVVINSLAGEEFSRRTGLSWRVIPNVMDFATPPQPPDEYAADFRASLGLADNDILVLQPTRVVRRKGIEHTVELVRRLNDPRVRLVITHGEEDEDGDYPRRIREYAQLLDVRVIFAAARISDVRGTTRDGRKVYAIWDVYPHADLVAYPSTYEGFGNAFLEAAYYRKPLLCNRYTIYRTDIEPCGFQAITMDGFLTGDVVERVRHLLSDQASRQAMVDGNYEAARRFFSYERVERELRAILAGELPAQEPVLTRP
jgi:glycosyltransferase involved in cell wall biosynthesis